jgi:hypothetical protein
VVRSWLAALALACATLGGCGDDQQRYDAVCVDPVSLIRVDDWQCQPNAGNNFFIWWYLLHSATQPRLGYVAVGGYRSPPARVKIYRGGVPTGGRYAAPPKPPVRAPQLNIPRPKPPPPKVVIRPPKIR